MSKATCDLRQVLAKGNGSNAYRAQYSFTCGQCKQIVENKRGVKMITEKLDTIGPTEDKPEFETTRTCRVCKELLPMDAFTKNNDCFAGREQTCKRCRTERKKLQEACRKSEKRRAADERIPAKARTAPVEPPCLPVGLPPGVAINSVPVIAGDDFSITVDFSCYMVLLSSISSLASREFRSPMMQILYMLNKYSD
jgi:hypothetical protein